MFGSTTCQACGQSYKEKEGHCPRCLVEVGATTLKPASAGGPAQIVRLYQGNNAMKDFTREARLLQRVGWIVTSQTAGGENTFKIGKRNPTQVSVTYGRQA